MQNRLELSAVWPKRAAIDSEQFYDLALATYIASKSIANHLFHSYIKVPILHGKVNRSAIEKAGIIATELSQLQALLRGDGEFEQERWKIDGAKKMIGINSVEIVAHLKDGWAFVVRAKGPQSDTLNGGAVFVRNVNDFTQDEPKGTSQIEISLAYVFHDRDIAKTAEATMIPLVTIDGEKITVAKLDNLKKPAQYTIYGSHMVIVSAVPSRFSPRLWYPKPPPPFPSYLPSMK